MEEDPFSITPGAARKWSVPKMIKNPEPSKKEEMR
jgi:hypothetical protein